MYDYAQAEREARALCDQVRDCPEGRRALRAAFYRRFDPNPRDGICFGDSELAFLDWELRAGVLDPKSGSPWWRAVNLYFIYLAELAGLLAEHGLSGEQAPMPTRHWLRFLEKPTPRRWYRAHNASILAGFERYPELAEAENEVGRTFINITLYRLLFAQALVQEATPFAGLGAFLADPRGPSVRLLVGLADFYPPHYPLTEADRAIIAGHGLGLQEWGVRAMDHWITHNLRALYAEAALWNDAPFLATFLDGDQPAYPPTPARRAAFAQAQVAASLEGVLAGQDLPVAEEGAGGL